MKNSTYPPKSSNNAKKSRYLASVSPRGAELAEVVAADALEREIEPVRDLRVEPPGAVVGLRRIIRDNNVSPKARIEAIKLLMKVEGLMEFESGKNKSVAVTPGHPMSNRLRELITPEGHLASQYPHRGHRAQILCNFHRHGQVAELKFRFASFTKHVTIRSFLRWTQRVGCSHNFTFLTAQARVLPPSFSNASSI
jgi:hypothetical protein